MRSVNGDTRSMNSALETINAAATAIASAENRVPQPTVQVIHLIFPLVLLIGLIEFRMVGCLRSDCVIQDLLIDIGFFFFGYLVALICCLTVLGLLSIVLNVFLSSWKINNFVVVLEILVREKIDWRFLRHRHMEVSNLQSTVLVYFKIG